MVICITRFGCTYSLEKQKQERKKKNNYFGTSGYSQEDIAATVLFADNLSRGDIHIHILLSTRVFVLTNKHV
jgi:hypothetical protein